MEKKIKIFPQIFLSLCIFLILFNLSLSDLIVRSPPELKSQFISMQILFFILYSRRNNKNRSRQFR